MITSLNLRIQFFECNKFNGVKDKKIDNAPINFNLRCAYYPWYINWYFSTIYCNSNFFLV